MRVENRTHDTTLRYGRTKSQIQCAVFTATHSLGEDKSGQCPAPVI